GFLDGCRWLPSVSCWLPDGCHGCRCDGCRTVAGPLGNHVVGCGFWLYNLVLFSGRGQPALVADELKTPFVDELPFVIILGKLPSAQCAVIAGVHFRLPSLSPQVLIK